MGTMVRFRSLPEGMTYKDDGCGGKCQASLACPYKTCVLDKPDLATTRTEIHERIAILRRQRVKVEDVMRIVGVSRRTVFRGQKCVSV